jgi:hypothetical protein
MSTETTEKKRRFLVYVDIDTFGSRMFVEADDEDEAREIVEGMSVAEVIERVSQTTSRLEIEVEDVEEVDEQGRSLAVLRRKGLAPKAEEEDDDDDA